jgi:signal transduction histidine kinase
MYLKINILFCFLLFAVTSLTQNSAPPVYEINADTSVKKIPDNYWEMLVDTNGNRTIEDVRSSEVSAKFHDNNTTQTGVGFSGNKTYWQRLKLKNNTGNEIKLVFSNMPWVDRYDLFIIRPSGKTEQLVSGAFVPMSKRDGYKDKGAIPVTLSPLEEITLYKRLYFDKTIGINELAIGFSSNDSFIREFYIDWKWYKGDVRQWFMAGILIFGFFINFFFFLINKDKVYLYMALLLLFEGIWYITLANEILIPEALTFWHYFVILSTGPIFWILVTQFVRQFLKTGHYYPYWDKTILVLLILYTIESLSQIFLINDFISKSNQWIFALTDSILFFLLMFSLLVSFLFFKKEKDKLTNLSVIAAVPAFLLWSIAYNFRNVFMNLASIYQWGTPSVLQWYIEYSRFIEMFCVGWFALLFTWIMLQKYALLRKQLAFQALERAREKNEIMKQQKELLEIQVEERTLELKKSLQELKSTQSQLIQSEKMASLGELTAGIAHEIQNPLNFVNNFSEVNRELMVELKEEIEKGDKVEALALVNELSGNEEKIHHHGKRADAIVKGMLQHSRTSAGQKEPSDLNVLCDEYLRLAYHGLKAKDKSFNADFKLDADPDLP